MFAVVAGVGIAMMFARGSRVWVAAGLAYAIGGVGFQTYYVIGLTGAFEAPLNNTAANVAVWFAAVGFISLLIAAVLTLVGIGRDGRHRFLIVFAAVTLTTATYMFWTSNWAARTGDVASRCFDTGYGVGPNAGIERIPPGVRCFDGTREVFVPADAICWLALVGWSLFYGFALSFPVYGLAWLAERRTMLAVT